MSDTTTEITQTPKQENGHEADYRFLATVEELKKTGQLTRWVDDHDILLYEHEGQIKARAISAATLGGR